MAQMNKSRSGTARLRTHEGARAMHENPIAALNRVMLAHMLWEDTFYVDGQNNADILVDAVRRAVAHDMPQAAMAIIDARSKHNIRHASLLAAVVFADEVQGSDGISVLQGTIQRPDELTEALVMGARGQLSHGVPIRVSNTVRKAVQRAFDKFDEYQLARYQGKGKGLSLKDAVFVAHPDPKRQPLVQKIVDGTLEIPNTWETRLSAGEDKKAVWEDLLRENKLGSMALLRNLRNMLEVGVSRKLVTDALGRANWGRVLPFRFMSAIKSAPAFTKALDRAFEQAVAGSTYLRGATAVLVDTSGSMNVPISERSQVRAWQAGATLAAAIRGDHVDLFEWASTTKQVQNWESLSSAMAIGCGRVGYGTNAGQAIAYANKTHDYDRIILITDMQFADSKLPALKAGQRGYTINVQPYKVGGLMSGKWTHFTGWSDQVLKFIHQLEEGDA